jgi:DNA-directed RNA polymerase specialized sigma24 family protein
LTHSPISAKYFSELLQSGNRKELDQLSGNLVNGIVMYLKMMHKLPEYLAQEYAQQAFIDVYEKIQNGELLEVDNISGYLINTARNMYLFKKDLQGRKETAEINEEIVADESSSIIDLLEDQQRKKLLMRCIDQLNKTNRKFIFTILRYIDRDDTWIAKFMGYEGSSFRVRKFRVIHILHNCVQKYLPS